ncbi:hypothetical protein J3R30DRAFT_651400 [Lentinula aciculospora]|uniref:Uncharacterized protein n=1 Tax=Lentinula aciculospora TaxID=153920 RepID=A0A9W9A4N2_9AGAR|nr:hypothetical protein J3R30DRAFT_651400 [Lentinula aciculospora]
MKKEEQVFGTGLANGSSFDNDSGTRRISIRLPPSTIVKQESEQDVVEETLLPALIVLPASGFEPVIQPFMKQEVEQEAGKDVGLDVGQDMRQEVEMEQEVVREVKQEVGVGELPVLVPNSSLGSLHQSPTPDPVAPIEPIQRIDPVTQRRSRLDRYSNQREDREDLVVKEEEQDAKVEENVTAGMDEHVDMLQDNSFDMLEGDVDMLVDDKVDDFKNLMDFRDLSSVEATNSSFISTVPQVQEAMHMPKPMDLYYAPVNAKNVIHIRGSNSGQQDEPREEMDEQEDNDDEKVDELIDDDAEDMNMDWGTSPTVPPQSAPTSLRRSSRFKPAATASASVTAVETYSPAPAPISVLTHTRVTPARASTSRSKSNSRIMSSTPLPYPANPSTSPFAFLSISPAPVSSSSSTSLSAAPAPKSSKPRKNGKTMNLGADKQRAGGKTHSTGKTTSGGAIKPAPSHISPAASARNAEMGRAYLLQRIRAESTNPTQALAYYRHAATFVPNNDRLRDSVNLSRSSSSLLSTKTTTIYGSSTEKHKIMISGISGLPSPMTPHKTARISKSKLKLSNVQTMSPSALDSPPTPPTSPTPTSLLPSQIPSKRDAESGPPPLPARKTAIPVCRLVQVST